MKMLKRASALLICAALIASCFAGCSSDKSEKYSDTRLIIGYTEELAPFLQIDENGKATGFEADLMKAIFDSVKGDLKDYTYEKVDEGYVLEEDGGFLDESGKEYSAGLLFAAYKNNGTFNETYSFTEPIITNRVIAVTAKDSEVKGFGDFRGARAITVSDAAAKALDENSAIKSSCKSVKAVASVDKALALLENGGADVLVVDEFSFMPSDKKDSFVVLDNELDTIEYVIACAKHSGWKDSLNEAIRELKSKNYTDGDKLTPLVTKYFGYNASSFNYETEGDK